MIYYYINNWFVELLLLHSNTFW